MPTSDADITQQAGQRAGASRPVPLLARLEGDVDDAFARYTAAVLAPGDPDPFPQNLFAERDDIAEPTGTPEHTSTVEVAGTAEHTDTVEVADTVGRVAVSLPGLYCGWRAWTARWRRAQP